MKSKFLQSFLCFIIIFLAISLSVVRILLPPDESREDILLPPDEFHEDILIKPDLPLNIEPLEKQDSTWDTNVRAVSSKKYKGSNLPTRLRIPTIHLDAHIEHVGLLWEAIDTPKNMSNVAWYKFWPLPGEKGSAIIDGHFGWVRGKPVVFNDLYKLHKWDKLYVDDRNGHTHAFIVRELRTYQEDDTMLTVLDSGDDKAHLNLITCQGIWNKTTLWYPDRLVVFTDKLE